MYLDDLPRWEKGDGTVKVGTINWKKSIGYKINFIYDNIMGRVEIVDYKDRYLYIEYLDKPIFKIFTGSFKNCLLGRLLGKSTSEFKVEIGQVFKDDKRDITIIDREIRTRYKKNGSKCNYKWYKYTCNKCGWTEGWIVESSLLKGTNCSCCTNQTVVEGINDIPTTEPWMVKYFQGGYDEAKLYIKCSGQRIIPICTDCGRINNKSIRIDYIYRNHSIGCICGDGISKPEKFMSAVLEQLNLEFTTQLNKTTFKWCDKYKYDFYFKYNGEGYIIEVNGEQHYKETGGVFIRTLREEQLNDKVKKELALRNGIREENYIVIDCRKSELEFIKQSILDSNLSKIVDLSKTDWNEAEEFALSNRVKEACNLWNSGIKSTKEISEIMKINRGTVIRYLNNGTKIWDWCNYNAKEETKNSGKLQGGFNKKQVEIFKDNKSFGIFSSCKELSKKSEELFGVKLIGSSISAVANGKRKLHKGYTFQYI